MRLLLAVVLPWLAFFTIGRPVAGIICLVLQITLLGWLPAAIWAGLAVNRHYAERKIEKALAQQSRAGEGVKG